VTVSGEEQNLTGVQVFDGLCPRWVGSQEFCLLGSIAKFLWVRAVSFQTFFGAAVSIGTF
jgi:hypothetical protein